MKRICIVLFVITALAVSMNSYGLDLKVDVKKKSCETACDRTYDECMKKAKEENEKAKNDVKKKTSDLACKQAKDECYKKCSK